MCQKHLNGTEGRLKNFKSQRVTQVLRYFGNKRYLSLQCVFHGIRLLRLQTIGCRETINRFFIAFF